MSIATSSRGKAVYGNGSYAPNRGQVSAQGAQGYLQRELNKNRNVVSPVGRDGQSDQRSGVAAAALSKVNNGKAPGENKPGGNKPGNITLPADDTRPNSSTGSHGGINPGGNTYPQQAQQPNVPQMPPVLQVNAAGVLELPFNYAYSQEVLSALGDYNSQLLDLQQSEQEQVANYASSKRNAGVNYEAQKVHTLSDNASRGTAFSSGYGLAVGRDANAYTNYLNDLEIQNTNFQNNSNNRRAAIVAAFNQMLQRAALDYANDLSGDAGDLGYGSDEPETPDPYTGIPGSPTTGSSGITYTNGYANINVPRTWRTGNEPRRKKKRKK